MASLPTETAQRCVRIVDTPLPVHAPPLRNPPRSSLTGQMYGIRTVCARCGWWCALFRLTGCAGVCGAFVGGRDQVVVYDRGVLDIAAYLPREVRTQCTQVERSERISVGSVYANQKGKSDQTSLSPC
jgi:hypothetical protein